MSLREIDDRFVTLAAERLGSLLARAPLGRRRAVVQADRAPVEGPPGPSVTTRLADPADLPQLFALRHRVFVVEQHVPVELERDELDAVSDHAVHVVDGAVVGTGRLLPDGTIGRMAVDPSHRGSGVGGAVLARLEQRARERGLVQVELHAQAHALGFYERAGWRAFGEPYDEAGIAHLSMRKELT